MGENTDPDPEMTSRQRREANLGVVLISISILFIACQSVKIIPDVYEVRPLRRSHIALPILSRIGKAIRC